MIERIPMAKSTSGKARSKVVIVKKADPKKLKAYKKKMASKKKGQKEQQFNKHPFKSHY